MKRVAFFLTVLSVFIAGTFIVGAPGVVSAVDDTVIGSSIPNMDNSPFINDPRGLWSNGTTTPEEAPTPPEPPIQENASESVSTSGEEYDTNEPGDIEIQGAGERLPVPGEIVEVAGDLFAPENLMTVETANGETVSVYGGAISGEGDTIQEITHGGDVAPGVSACSAPGYDSCYEFSWDYNCAHGYARIASSTDWSRYGQRGSVSIGGSSHNYFLYPYSMYYTSSGDKVYGAFPFTDWPTSNDESGVSGNGFSQISNSGTWTVIGGPRAGLPKMSLVVWDRADCSSGGWNYWTWAWVGVWWSGDDNAYILRCGSNSNDCGSGYECNMASSWSNWNCQYKISAQVNDIWLDPSESTFYSGGNADVFAQYKNTSPIGTSFDCRIKVYTPSGVSSWQYIDNWSFGAGESKNLYWPSYHFDQPGTYQVTAEIWDSSGYPNWTSTKYGTRTETFTIRSSHCAEVEDIWLDPSNITSGQTSDIYADVHNCGGTSDTFDVRILTWKPDSSSTWTYIDNWSFSANQTRRLRWGSYLFDQSGTYTIRVEVWDSSGCCSWSSTRYTYEQEGFSISPPPIDAEVQDIWLDPAEVRAGQTADVYAKFKNLSPVSATFDARIVVRKPSGSESTGFMNNWTFTTGQIKDCYTDNFNFDQSGTYTITAEIFDNQGYDTGWPVSRRFDTRTETFSVLSPVYNAQVLDIWVTPDSIVKGGNGDIHSDIKNTSTSTTTLDARIIMKKPSQSSTYQSIDDMTLVKDQIQGIVWLNYLFDETGTYTITTEVYDSSGKQSGWATSHRFHSRTETYTVGNAPVCGEVRSIWLDPSDVQAGETADVYAQFKNCGSVTTTFDARIIVYKPDSSGTYQWIDDWSLSAGQIMNRYRDAYMFDQSGQYRVCGEIYDNQGVQSGWASTHRLASMCETFTIQGLVPTPTPPGKLFDARIDDTWLVPSDVKSGSKADIYSSCRNLSRLDGPYKGEATFDLIMKIRKPSGSTVSGWVDNQPFQASQVINLRTAAFLFEQAGDYVITTEVYDIGGLQANWNIANRLATFSKTLTIQDTGTPTPTPRQGIAVVVNQVGPFSIASSPPGVGEYVELYNNSSSAINLSGWKLRTYSGDYTFDSSDIIQGRSFFLISEINPTGYVTPDVVADIDITDNGVNSYVRLLNASGAVQDTVGWSTSTIFEGTKLGTLATGKAWLRDTDGADTDNNANDFSQVSCNPRSGQGGTPTPTPPNQQQSINLGPITVYADYVYNTGGWPKRASGRVSINNIVKADGDLTIASTQPGVYTISGNCRLFIVEIPIQGLGTVPELTLYEGEFTYTVDGNGLAKKYLNRALKYLKVAGIDADINHFTFLADGVELGADLKWAGKEGCIKLTRLTITRSGVNIIGKMSVGGIDIEVKNLNVTNSAITLAHGTIVFPESFSPGGVSFDPESRSYSPINSSCGNYAFSALEGDGVPVEANSEESNGEWDVSGQLQSIDGYVDKGQVPYEGKFVAELSRVPGIEGVEEAKEENIDVYVVDENGHYTFSDLPESNYRLRMSARITLDIDGLTIDSSGFHLSAGEITNIPDLTYAGIKLSIGSLGFSTEPVSVTLKNTRIHMPTAMGGGTILLGTLTVSEKGVAVDAQLTNFSFNIPGTGFKITIQKILFDTINERYGGQGKISIPGLPDIVIGVGFNSHELLWVHAEVQGMNIPIYAVVFLQRISLDVTGLESGPPPVLIVGQVGISAGPKWWTPFGDVVLLAADPIALTIDTSDYVQLSGELTLFKPTAGIAEGSISFLFWDWDYSFSGFNVLKALVGLSQTRGFYAQADLDIIEILKASSTFNIDPRWNVSGRGTGVIQVPPYIPVIGSYQLGGFEEVLTNNYIAGEGWITSIFSLAAKFSFDGKIKFGSNLEDLGVTVVPQAALLAAHTDGEMAASPSFWIEVPPNKDRAAFRFAWTDNSDTDVSLISPQGETITPSMAPKNNAYYNYIKDGANHEIWYVVKDPAAGTWQYRLTNRSIGNLTVQLMEIEEPPTVEMASAGPQVTSGTKTNGDSVRLTWSTENLIGDETISLYYDTNNEGYDGSLIATGNFAAQGFYDWVLDSTVPSGQWFIYAIIDNGRSMPRGSYMAGTVKVENPNAPEMPRNLMADEADGKVTLTWDTNSEEDLLSYVIEWTDDLSAINFDKRLAVGFDTSYTLDQLDNGRTYKIRVKAVNNDGYESLPSEVQLVAINVATSNCAPHIVSMPKTKARQGEQYTYQVDVSDADEMDILTYSFVKAPAGMTIDEGSGLIQWAPGLTDVGRAKVVVRVQDTLLYEDTQEFSLDVYNDYIANIAPEIASDPQDTAEVGQAYAYEIGAADVDGDTLSYTLLTAPEGMTVDADGVIHWTPTEQNVAGENLVEIKVTDGHGGVAIQGFNIFLKWFSAYGASAVDTWLDPNATQAGSYASIYAQFLNQSKLNGPYQGAATFDARIIVKKPDGTSTYGCRDNWAFAANQSMNLYWQNYYFNQAGTYKITAQIYDINGRESGWSWWHQFDSRTWYFTMNPGPTPTPTSTRQPTATPTPTSPQPTATIPPIPTDTPPGSYADIRVAPLSMTFDYSELPAASSLLGASVQGEPASLDISTGDNSIVLDVDSGSYSMSASGSAAAIQMEGFDIMSSPGDPALPHKVYRIALPPDADISSARVTLDNETVALLDGEYEIAPAPPLATWDGTQVVYAWGEGKQIVNGANVLVYGSDANYPALASEIISDGQMRKWKFVEVDFRPFRYNPVQKRLTFIETAQITVSYAMPPTVKTSQASSLMADTVMDDQAALLFDNFAQAAEQYAKSAPVMTSEAPSATYNYVIITSNAIRNNSGKLSSFVTLKKKLGFTVKVVTEDDFGSLTGPAPNGRAEKIRKWLQDNYVSMGIKYVLLIGDPRTDSSDVPMKMSWPRYNETWETSYKESPTDHYYADLSGNWDKDGDTIYGEYGQDTGTGGADRAAEVYVGRIPVYNSDYSMLDSILQKTMDYDNPSGDISWRDRILLPMKPSDGSTPGWQLGEGIKNDYAKPKGFTTYRIYDQTYNISPAPEMTPCSSTNVQNEWANGYGMVTWWTHGSETSAVSVFASWQCQYLDNAKPAFTFQCSCTNGSPETTDNLGYALLKRGSVGTVSASRVSWYNPGAWNLSGSNSGMAYRYTGRVLNADPVGQALFQMKVGENIGSAEYWMNQTDFNLYGDPSLVLTSQKNMTIYNDGSSDLLVNGINAQSGSSWLKVMRPEHLPLTVAPGDSGLVGIRVNRGGVNAGTYSDRLLISSNDADESPYPGAEYVTLQMKSSAKPDLKVNMPLPDDGATQPPFNPGQTIDWYAYVSNTGAGDASPCTLGYYLGSSATDYSRMITSSSVELLQSGGSTVKHQTYPFTESDRGQRWLNIWIDKDSAVREEQESNNKGSYGPFWVGEPYTPTPTPTCTPTPTPVPPTFVPTATPVPPTPTPVGPGDTPTPGPTATPAPPGQHLVSGLVFNLDGSYPPTLLFKAYIVGKPADILNEVSPGSSYSQTSGVWQLDTGNFAGGWTPGDLLHVSFLNTYNGQSGSWEYTLNQSQTQAESDVYYLNGQIRETDVLKTTTKTSLNAVTLLEASILNGNGECTAEQFAQRIPNCTVLYRWDATTQSYSGHIKGRSMNNYTAQAYQSYFASLNGPGTLTQNGIINNLPYYHMLFIPTKTSINWITLPTDMIHLETAEDLAQDVGVHCKVVYRWLVESQSWSGHIRGRSMNNFKLRPLEPYFISVDAEIYWP
ncbi:MAG: lamin tail domain-containing protein [Candidatus Aureabacteria bacterium]|nr:lamin tail domain-containing protein [Candidatus Auribacterota bacterium]